MYKHTQIGWSIIITLIAIILLGYFGILGPGMDSFVYSILILTLVLFSTLTITVEDKLIKLRFGPIGFPRKTFNLAEIESCKPSKSFWYGISIGIHFSRRVALYNVSGTKAVELTMKNGKVRLVGTDEPEKLSEFIQNELNNTF